MISALAHLFLLGRLHGRFNKHPIKVHIRGQNLNKVTTFSKPMKIIPAVSIHLISGRFFTHVLW
jgi:hypothetical protein